MRTAETDIVFASKTFVGKLFLLWKVAQRDLFMTLQRGEVVGVSCSFLLRNRSGRGVAWINLVDNVWKQSVGRTNSPNKQMCKEEDRHGLTLKGLRLIDLHLNLGSRAGDVNRWAGRLMKTLQAMTKKQRRMEKRTVKWFRLKADGNLLKSQQHSTERNAKL